MTDIKLVALDFDGVITNNKVITDEDGKESVICDRSDGIGIEMLKKAGVRVIVISSEMNGVVEKRCTKLGIESHTGIKDKLLELKLVMSSARLSREEVVYVGNDINDLSCLMHAGYPICVKGSPPEVKELSRYETKREGGNGAVREVCELIVEGRLP